MKIEDHMLNLDESLKEIENSIISGVTDKQRTIGFHTSAACVDMLEILLHKNNYIDYGTMLKHEWFTSLKKAKEKIPYEFEGKNKILELIVKIEEKRNILCYGKRQKEEVLVELIKNFNEVKKIFKSLGVI